MPQKLCHLSKNVLKCLAVMLVILCQPLGAHEVPASRALLDIGVSSVGVELHLPAEELRSALELPNGTGAAELSTKHADLVTKHINEHFFLTTQDGIGYLSGNISLSTARMLESDWVTARLAFTAPKSTPTRIFVINNDVIVSRVITHNIFVSVRSDFRNGIFDHHATPNTEYKLAGLLHYQQKQLTVESDKGGWLKGTTEVFKLGMKHIAEGTDHILFLLVLLLVAPLLANNHQWNHSVGIGASLINILKTVTGFTLGHSLTLALGATGVVSFPSKPVEVLIALSILVSAAHAIRPLFAYKEHWVAAFFGLIHGMAFATSLTGFDYDPYVLGLAVIGFNLGIEAMQLLIVIVVLPTLLLLKDTWWYRPLRVGTAICASLLALAWVAERAFNANNPMNILSDGVQEYAVSIIISLTLLGIAARIQVWRREGRVTLTNVNCGD